MADSIVGEWQFDSVRTLSEHMERQGPADGVEPEAFAAQLAEAKTRREQLAPFIDPQIRLNITENHIHLSAPNADDQTMSYTVIGGNARLVVVELEDTAGYEGVGTIRIEESGLVFVRTDCDTYPDQCEMERQRARQRAEATRHADNASQTVIPAEDVSRVHTDTPRLVYFRPLEAGADSGGGGDAAGVSADGRTD